MSAPQESQIRNAITDFGSWSDFPGPTHQEAMQRASGGQPTIQEQNLSHGAPAPAEDHGVDDHTKYGGAC